MTLILSFFLNGLYNIFMFRNVKMSAIISPLSGLLLTISAPARLEILLIVGAGEACVCYLESRLGYRQAYISQHLMALRQAGLIDSRREGKYVFYRRIKPNPDKPEPNRKAKRESCSTGRGRKAPYTSQRLENEVSIKLPQEEVATFPQKYFSTRRHRN
jgi:DNA-binding transcriptional ArsR family regulator